MTFKEFLQEQYCLTIEEFSELDGEKKKLYESEFESFLQDLDEEELNDYEEDI